MKKKGLLISTIVMVVVLVASLTTATYAWFTTETRTSLTGFNLSVESNTAVKIGLKSTVGYTEGAGYDAYYTGNCTFADGVNGKLSGTWSSDTLGLGSNLQHNIVFGSVKSAVALTNVESLTNSLTDGQVGGFKKEGVANSNTDYAQATSILFKANGSAGATGTIWSETPVEAVVNGDDSNPGDLAYLSLGVAPSKDILDGTHYIYVVIQSTDSSTIGIAAAMHVAYNVNNTGWNDVDAFGATTAGTLASLVNNTDIKYNLIPSGDTTISRASFVPDEGETTKGVLTIPGAAVVAIPLTHLTVTNDGKDIDHVELVIYLAGYDSDCNNNAIQNSSVNIGIYFGAQPAPATQGN